MPRNSSGSMSPANGPYLSGTTISSTAVNARFGDIETEITDSASRSGKGGFTAPVRTAPGTVAAPSFAYTSEPGSGMYLAAAGDLRLAIGGVDFVTPNGISFTGSAGFGPVLTTTVAGKSVSLLGNLAAASGAADVQIGTTATRTAGFIAAFQNPINAGNKLLVDYNGLLTLANQAASSQPLSIWTVATLNAGWTGTVSYYKDATGRVQVKGAASFATGGASAAFNLPAGFRAAKFIPIVDWSTFTTVPASVDATTGAVSVVPSGGPVNLHLYYFDSIAFVAEA